MLAGDHLKAASDLGVPLVGVGLFYRHGYFRQELTPTAGSRSATPTSTRYAWRSPLCDGVRVDRRPRRLPLAAQVWRADVGPLPLYLLDADIDENHPTIRAVTDRLYGGDTEHRLRQEILLGIGGVRALRPSGIDAAGVPHQRGPRRVPRPRAHPPSCRRAGRAAFAEAIEAVRAGTLFTTHTPVPAGIDRFPRELMEQYFAGWAQRVRRRRSTSSWRSATGPTTSPTSRFNMAVMGLRLAGRSNGVSKLHGAVSRDDVRRPVARRARRRGADRLGHQRRPRPHLGRRRRWTTCSRRYVLPEWDEADAEPMGPHRRRPRRRAVAGPRAGPRAARGASSAAGCATAAPARGVVGRDVAWTDEVLDPQGAHHRLRPPLRHLQAGHPAAVPARPAARPCCCPPTGRCSSCSPARPTRPTTRGKEMIRQIVRVRRRPRRPPPVRVPRRLRHRRRPRALPGLPTSG